MMAPVLNIVTGSTSDAGEVMPKTPVPPRLIAPPEDPADVELSEADDPQAARMVPSTEAETPRTLARTSTCWRVIRPARASSYRWYSSSFTSCTSLRSGDPG